MRYAIVTETYPPEINGVALTVQSLEHGLRDRGHAVETIRPRQSRYERPAEHETLVSALPLPRYPGLRFGLPAARRLTSHWTHRRPDAIYVATEGPLGWSALRAARRLRIPVATGFHTRFDRYMRDYGASWLEPVALAWMRRFHNGAQATLVPTEELRAELAGLRFDNVVRLSRAVDLDLFHPGRRDDALRAEWGLGPDDVAVVHVGRIAAEKNLPLAVAAFRALQAQRPDARFVWVGDGPMRAELAGQHPDFLFPGVQRGESLARHFASADLFLFPSRSETYGNVTLEALACGVPTVAFDYGAARERLRDGRDGAAVGDDEGADDAFVRAAVRIGADAALRAAMRASARTAVDGLHPRQVAADFDAILQSMTPKDSLHARPTALAPSARE